MESENRIIYQHLPKKSPEMTFVFRLKDNYNTKTVSLELTLLPTVTICTSQWREKSMKSAQKKQRSWYMNVGPWINPIIGVSYCVSRQLCITDRALFKSRA